MDLVMSILLDGIGYVISCIVLTLMMYINKYLVSYCTADLFIFRLAFNYLHRWKLKSI